MQKYRVKGFTLVEIMIVVAIIGIIIAIAIPSFIRARETSRSRACQENLSKIDGAKELYALDNNLGEGDTINGGLARLVGATNYIKQYPVCPSGGDDYTDNLGAIGEAQTPACTYVAPAYAPVHDITP